MVIGRLLNNNVQNDCILWYRLRQMRCLYRYNYESLCAIALIQNDTPTSKMKPLLDKRNPLINAFL